MGEGVAIETLILGAFGLVAIAYAAIAALLLVNRPRSRQGHLFVAAIFSLIIWAGGIWALAFAGGEFILLALVLDSLRALVWISFLVSFISFRDAGFVVPVQRWLLGAALAATFIVVVGVASLLFGRSRLDLTDFGLALICLSLLGLVAVEQIYRNADSDERWALKPLCISVGLLFAYDLFVYSDMTLLGTMGIDLWAARGLVALICSPFLLLSAKRQRDWASDLFVSRKIVFYSATLMGVGLYLVSMAAVGYLIRLQSGEWGRTWQTAFLISAALLLAYIVFSADLRRRAQVFLSKHFYRNRYDYREEWLRLIRTLTKLDQQPIGERGILALGEIIGSRSGQLWIAQGPSLGFDVTQAWNQALSADFYASDDPLVRFIERTGWIVDTEELRLEPDVYENELDADSLPSQVLVVPLFHEKSLLGFVMLDRPPDLVSLNYEDHDLLKTAGQQVAAILAEEKSKEQLTQTRQFEAVNRLSTFLMHDLKNVVAQQELLVRNAARHKHNPDFVEDVITTVRNSVSRIRKLLNQLEHGRVTSPRVRTDLNKLICTVSRSCRDRLPEPDFTADGHAYLWADPDRLAHAFEHAIRNAQDATPDSGSVSVAVSIGEQRAIVEISDTGCGMDAAFIRNRLFRPFDTTKGTRGMGIGSYQLQELVKELGGTISVTSEPGLGTTFRIELPTTFSGASSGEPNTS